MAEKWVMERLEGVAEPADQPRWVARWGAEAAMPPERDQTPGEQAEQARRDRIQAIRAAQAAETPTDPFWNPEPAPE
jgi:hypothetical protein